MSARHAAAGSAAAGSAASAELRRRAAHLPRVALAHLPTPLEEMPRLAAHLGGPRLFIKRDDCTGLAFGGNKTRHNEFLLGEALAQGADLIVWGAGVQSNNCRQTAAACAKLGLDIHLVLARGHASTELQGNLLLDHIAGASYEFVDAALGPELDRVMAERAEQFRTAGRTVYVQSRALWGRAAVSYVLAMAELDEQLRERQVEPAAVYVSAAGATGAGLVLGAAHLAAPGLVRSVLPIRWPWDEAASVADLANQAAALLNLPPNLTAEQVRVDGGHVGPGYGQASPEGMAALALVARLEGILLDPVYTAKAMAALIADVRAGRYAPDQAVVFVHTGGTPALFAYRDDIARLVPRVTHAPPA